MEHCPQCSRLVVTFVQTHETLPTDITNRKRRYTDTLCSECGILVHGRYEDIEPNDDGTERIISAFEDGDAKDNV